MGLKKWRQNVERVFKAATLRQLFYIFTITLLSLLLPLSFLLLSRLSSVQYILTISPYVSKPSSFLLSIFLYTNPTLLHVHVSFIGVTTLIHGLTGRVALTVASPVHQSRLYLGWILLCTTQVCVALGIEGSIAAGIWKVDYDVETNNTFLSRTVFFVGLHEIMIHWSRVFVRPVVDDTVFGVVKDDQLIERVVMGATFGVLWWWRLRDEVECLLTSVAAKRESSMALGVADLVSWWLYYLTVTIGLVRFVWVLIWIGKVLLCRTVVEGSHGCSHVVDEKV